MIIVLLFAISIAAACVPIIAAGIVAIASRREDSGRTLAGPARNAIDAAARRIAGLPASGLSWLTTSRSR